ncbi:MAG TPA: hypothetical protein VNW47_17095 [Terriglobales bacterium]|nr:hypothetical protein [Terriglobales bacterium]
MSALCNALVVKKAAPLFSGTVASTLVPSLKVIVPVGVPPLETTVAENVTACPTLDGFCELVSDVPVEAFFTTCFKVVEVLPANNASPL